MPLGGFDDPRRGQPLSRWLVVAAASVVVAATAACSRTPHHDGDGAVVIDSLSPLRDFERDRRAHTDFAALPTADRALGPDPYAIAPLALRCSSGARCPAFAGVLRNRSAWVLLGEDLTELARLPAPEGAAALAVGPPSASGAVEVWVAGDASPLVARFVVGANGEARPDGGVELTGVRAIRALALGPERVLYAAEEHDDRIVTADLAGVEGSSRAHAPLVLAQSDPRRHDVKVDAAPLRLSRVGAWLVADCLLGHSLVALPVGAGGRVRADGAVRVRHDGPIWGFDAVADGDGVLIAAGGVEDHPLDRTEGSFGFVDSFVFVTRVGAAGAERLASVDVSEVGVVTPKALALRRTSSSASILVTGYGGERMAELSWSSPGAAAPWAAPRVTTRPLAPGSAALALGADGALVVANPLLDAWGRVPAAGEATFASVADPGAPERSLDSRLGEALLFTIRMAPWNSTEGRLSRFTCETCHFEGRVDGRVHHTGRADVHATTKPLLGLFNNRPYFSRALDPDLVTVSHNEFRVAGALSGHEPWFPLAVADAPWLSALGAAGDASWSPVDLRRAVMAFLMDQTHRPNPSAAGRDRFSDLERRGAAVFRDRCERCHASRLVSDDPSTAVAFDRWEASVFAAGPIVWGRSGYEKTGVEPYVHADGARVPSLRRLYAKRPYFTNGSAPDLASVLDAVRFRDDGACWHRAPAAPSEEGSRLSALDDGDKAALLAFLDLL